MKSSAIAILFFALSTGAWAFGGKVTTSSEGTAPASSSSDTVWVTRSDGARSCEANSAQSLEAGEKQLKNGGVAILDSTKTSDGKMHAQMCGISSGTMNAYQIRRSDLSKAMTLGYQEATKDSAPPLFKH